MNENGIAKGGHGTKENQTSDNPNGGVPHTFAFGRMFPLTENPPLILRLDTCRDLGNRMTAMPKIARGDSNIPAGYTHFGQFVDHDLTLDTTEEKGREADDPRTNTVEAKPDRDLLQERSPSLDLDSLYGSTQGANPALQR